MTTPNTNDGLTMAHELGTLLARQDGVSAPAPITGHRVPPSHLLAEVQFLGACLLFPNYVRAFRGLLPAQEAFYKTRHQILWGVLLGLDDTTPDPEDITLVQVAERLQHQGKLEEVGGLSWLSSLSDGQPVMIPSRVELYAGIVRKLYQMRRLIAHCDDVINMAYDAASDQTDDVMAQATEGLLAIEGMGSHKVATATEAGDAAIDLISQMLSGQIATLGWGLPLLDNLLYLRPNKYLGIAARPGVGKTAIWLALVAATCLAGQRVVFFSLEMDKDEIVVRLACLLSGCPMEVAQGKRKPDHPRQLHELRTAVDQVKQWPLHIDDTPGLNHHQISSRSLSIAARYGDVALVGVDYFQLMGPAPAVARSSRREQLDDASAGLMRLKKSKSLGAAVVVLAQLNREVTKRGGRGGPARPYMSDIKDCGALEQDCDAVLLMDREVDDATGKFGPECQLWVDKNRSGDLGRLNLYFQGSTQRYSQLPFTLEPEQEVSQ